MADVRIREEVLQLIAPDTSWLSAGWNGGRIRADAAYNCTVPEGWERTDLDEYIADRRADAGFEKEGPALLTGVEMRHARCGRLAAERDTGETDRGGDSVDVLAVATAGVSNPAVLCPGADADAEQEHTQDSDAGHPEPGTVNVLVHVDHPLAAGALANLIAVVAEAKAATLLRETGFPGTTTDAVIVGATGGMESDEPIRFTGSGTPIGAAVRACVRDALRASLTARYDETSIPETVERAEYGAVTTRSANVFRP
ncbi:adenosylcobinamide amidohydrolase [Natranaeroarchaeum sulfidigenes]|uniref:Adenosylcobinamide amidohydrolase n=1 Tax=Natranaeroarchaeum sulfidigenes TaxID=2784880 RepID=A0A897MSL3_9EURY|nr:adenosylcobinamide amidohydrolase [Natranaeroarchaeum sulfidigenes]QSG03472.1 Adenosylcobinamide amidohydrolase [Natranaeroarchaeum sulfidigenes]